MFHVDPRSDEALPTSCQFRATILALLFVLHPILAHAEFMRKVVGVIDGDSIRVMHDGKAEQVRLLEVDCPEKRQPFGTRAKDYTSELAFGQDVTVTETSVTVMEDGWRRSCCRMVAV